MSDFIVNPTSISQASIEADMEAWLAAQPDFDAWSLFYKSTTGQAFIKLTSGMMAFLKYDSMMARRESFIQFAVNRSSIIAEAEFLGYSAFRGRNAILSITFVPAASGVLSLWDSIGLVKNLDMLVLTPTAYTHNVPCTVSVLLGTVMSQTVIAPDANLNFFRFTTPGVSDDIRMYIDSVEVSTSNIITDLLNGKFNVLTNHIGSVDAKYLNQAGFTQYAPGSQIQLSWVELNNLTFALSDIAVDPGVGVLSAQSITNLYQAVESSTSIKVNAPLQNETDNAVRGRNDMQKIYKRLNATFIDAKGIDISAAVIRVVGLSSPNYLRLSPAEKDAAQTAFTAYRMNGLMPPVIGDPSELSLTLGIQLFLNTNVSGSVEDLVASVTSQYLNVLNPTINLYDIENELSLSDIVRIARISIQGPTWAGSTSYPRGQIISPPSPNGFVYRLTKIVYKSGSTEPTWPTVAGQTIVDAGIVWTAVANLNPGATPAWAATTAYDINAQVKPTSANGFVYICNDQVNLSGSVEPTWSPLGALTPAELAGTKTNDGKIIWVARVLEGTPANWQANHDYQVGDLVVATNPTSSNTIGVMFQAEDYRAPSGSSVPAFPTVVDNTVADGSLIWKCVDPKAEKFVLDIDQYLTLTTNITTA